MSSADRSSSFATTRWSVVVAAGQSVSPESRRALEELCRAYWYPLYAFLRRRGYQAADAQEITQSYFTELLEKDRLQVADQQRGRFRSFLLASMQNFLQHRRRNEAALKRGGGHKHLSLDFEAGESRYRLEPVDAMTPELIFDRRWAMALLESAVNRTYEEYATKGKAALFEALKSHLGGDPERQPYTEIAARLELSESAIKVAAHRLRQRCRELLREEIAATVAEPADIEDELRHLFSTLATQ